MASNLALDNQLIARAASAIASGMRRAPVLYDPNGKPIPSSAYQYERGAAKRQGSMKNWIPKRLISHQSEQMQREQIVERSIDLVQNDPHAGGIIESLATTIVGSGLVPEPSLDASALGMTKEAVQALQARQRAVYNTWSPWADAGERMNDGAIQYLVQRCMLQYGEYFVLLPMINNDPVRHYSLACQVIHPLRVETPHELYNDPNIRDGIELGEYGQPAAYWVRKGDRTASGMGMMSSSMENFVRIPARVGHRWNMLHDFICEDTDDVRGTPILARGMKFFRDLNDYFDAELVSNVVTAVYAMFIETGDVDPMLAAQAMAGYTERPAGESERRYEEMVPGQIMYGSAGQKPHAISADRPGPTFKIFIKEIKKALALSVGMPYVTLFKDVEETNYAGFRSAMLDAWRVFTQRRMWLGQRFNDPRRKMLLEEAYLMGELDMPGFYDRMDLYCACQWIGSPKGNIEPIKEVQADVIAIKNNLKTRAAAISERGGEWRRTFDQLEEETRDLESKGLNPGLDPIEDPNAAAALQDAGGDTP